MEETIKDILMRRDGMSSEDADDLIMQAYHDLHDRLISGEDADDICEEYFGLEPDYLMELINI